MNNLNTAPRKWALAGTTALLSTLSFPALADVAHIAPELLVTAPGGTAPIEEVGSSVTVITAAEIEQRQYRTLADALKAVPGMHIVQLGAKGTVTSAFSRGGNSNHTLVLLNGIEINDPAAANGAFDFSTLTTENIERIEVVRGPQSGLYGSAAMGGVINIITKKGEGAPRTSLKGELGTLGTFNSSALTDGSYGGVSYALSLSRQYTKGNEITPERLRAGFEEEEDGNENVAASAQFDFTLSDSLSAFAFGQYVDGETDYDNTPQDFNATALSQEYFLNGGFKGNFMGGSYRPQVTFAYTDYTRRVLDKPDAGNPNTDEESTNDGTRFIAKLDNYFEVAGNNFNLGGQYKKEDFESRGFRDFGGGFVQTLSSSADEYTLSYWLTDRVSFGERFFASASLRYDDPEHFDGELTYTVTPGYYHPETDTRLTFSYGTGFRAPSLFERFGFTPNSFGNAYFGNPDLDPETSEGWEAGIEQGLLDGRVQLGATYFDTDYEDGIVTVFLPSFDSTTQNISEFNAHGVESFVDVQILSNLTARTDYTFTVLDTDEMAGSLTRRPRHKVHGTLDWNAGQDIQLGAAVTWVDLYRDVSRANGAVIDGDDYTVVDFTGSKDFGEHFQIFARVNNVLDADYEPADGYQAPGREFALGVKVTF